jgi:hypothetical protein
MTLQSLLRLSLALTAGALGLLLAVPIVLAGLPFWLVTRLTAELARRREPLHVPWSHIIEFDPALGWKPKANLDAHYLISEEPDIFSVRTDADGWPGMRSIAQSDIVVFGDSYAFGYGVDATAMFSERPGAARIKAIGAPGYSMVQGLLLMRRLAPQLAGKDVVWFVFLGNDLLENLLPAYTHYYGPFVREGIGGGSWEIVTSHTERRRWPFLSAPARDGGVWQRMTADLHRSTALARRAYAACEFLIGEGARVCAEAEARLAVMTIPDPKHVRPPEFERLFAGNPGAGSYDAALPDKKLAEICHRLGVRFIAGKEFLDSRHYKAIDPHWNEAGHQRVAEALWALAPAEAPEFPNEAQASADLPSPEVDTVVVDPRCAHSRRFEIARMITGPRRSA